MAQRGISEAELEVARFLENVELARRHAGLPDDFINFHHDPLACAVAAGWDGGGD